jgi:hypothetical protein
MDEISSLKLRAVGDVPKALIVKSLPLHASRSISLTLIEVSLKAPLLSSFIKVEFGVKRISLSQAVVRARPCPNSIGAPDPKLIFAARVGPRVIAQTTAPIPRMSFKGFFERGQQGCCCQSSTSSWLDPH